MIKGIEILNNGNELEKVKIKSNQNGTLTLDSDEFELLNLDCEVTFIDTEGNEHSLVITKQLQDAANKLFNKEVDIESLSNEEKNVLYNYFNNKFNHPRKMNDLVYYKNGNKVPIFYQDDYNDFIVHNCEGLDKETIATVGCCFTAAAMILTYALKDVITPEVVANNYKDSYYIHNAGTNGEMITKALNDYGLKNIVTEDYQEVVKAMNEGAVVVSHQKTPSLFTKGGHYIVISPDGKGGIFVNDPNIANGASGIVKDYGFDSTNSYEVEGKGYGDRTFTEDEIKYGAYEYYVVWPK